MKGLCALLFWLLIWQLIALRVGKELILPGPLTVWYTLVSLAGTAAFWQSTLASLLRVLLGFAAGVVAGVCLALLTAASKTADMLLSPAIRVIRATPVASFIILVLLWIARALIPTLIAALMVIPVVWGALYSAIRETDPLLLEMARAYRFSRWKTLRLVYLPSVLPAGIASLLTAQGLAWKSGVAAEVLCLPAQSIGRELYYSRVYILPAELFAWTAVVIALSFLLEKGCRLLLGRWSGR